MTEGTEQNSVMQEQKGECWEETQKGIRKCRPSQVIS